MKLGEQSVTDLITFLFRTEYHHRDDFRQLPRPRYSFGYVISGSAEFFYRDRQLSLRAGDIVFVPLGASYRSFWTGQPETRLFSCQFNFRPFSEPFRTHAFDVEKIADCGALHDDFAFMYAHQDDPAHTLAVFARFYALCDMLWPKLHGRLMPEMDSRIKATVAYMDAHCAQRITVAELARLSHMSEPHFYACFKAATGFSPIDYKNRTCINRAAQLLTDDRERSIEEISAVLGFSSSAYFRRLFKAITGVTPREYRRSAATI